MTFAQSLLNLVRAGARIETADRSVVPAAMQTEPEEAEPLESEFSVDPGEALTAFEPSVYDLEAAVELVVAGLATRVILSGFPSWPGLLWRAHQLADESDVLIMPTVVRPGGRVDIVITRDIAADG